MPLTVFFFCKLNHQVGAGERQLGNFLLLFRSGFAKSLIAADQLGVLGLQLLELQESGITVLSMVTLGLLELRCFHGDLELRAVLTQVLQLGFLCQPRGK